MKRMIYSFALLCMGATILMAQADYKMWRTVSFEPKIDQIVNFEKNMAAHNKKYHNEANKTASVWYNLTGSNAGKYVVAIGPVTFTGDYEEVHGDVSWRLLLEELQDVVVCFEDELSMKRSDLSGGE